MKFADNDILTVSNLNRFRAGICDLGINKAVLSARQVYEVNPYALIQVFPHGLDMTNIKNFLLKPKIDVLIEEMDNLSLKITVRELARAHRIPTLMVTGNGANVILDIERFDIDQNLPLLNGYLHPEIIERIKTILPQSIDIKEKIQLARDFMNSEELTERLQRSFALIGSQLSGIPQLAESSFLRGAVIAYCVRQLATGDDLPSGRYYLELDRIIKKNNSI